MVEEKVWHDIEIEDETLQRMFEQGWVAPVIRWELTAKGDFELGLAIERLRILQDDSGVAAKKSKKRCAKKASA